MSKTAIVIGAGITGVAAAEWLRRAGVSVTLVDRIEPGAPEQTSYGNAGLLARSSVIPVSEPGLMVKGAKMLFDPDAPLFLKWRYLPRLLPWLVPFLRNGRVDRITAISSALTALTHDTVDQHLALARGTEAEQFIVEGDYAYYYRSRKDYEKDAFSVDLRRAAGFEPQELDRAALLARDPDLSERYQFGVLFKDHGWLTSPGEYVAALAGHFVAEGGEFVQAEVQDVAEGRVALADGQVLEADKIVLTAGAWSGKLARRLGQKPMLEAERGYHLYLKGASYLPPTPFMVSDAKFVVTPMKDGLRCAGIVEFGGLEAPMSKAPIELLKKRIGQVYPSLTWDSEEVWMGHRPSTPDSLPHLGALRDAPGVICAYGAQHIGITVGPKLGRLVADMVIGERVNMDLSPYDPDRFS